MAAHSSILAYRIPGTEEPGGLPPMGSHRVGHDWSNLACMHAYMHWRRKWQPTPVFLLGESQGRGSWVGFRLRGCTESETTDATWQHWPLFLIYIYMFFFGKLFRSFADFFSYWVICFLITEFSEFFIYSRFNTSIRYVISKHFSQPMTCLFYYPDSVFKE